MPLYLRNALTLTPPSMSELPDDDFVDFLQDPDLLKDTLPQPYRLLDKFLTRVFEKAWGIISSRETERIAEASRIRPPQYQTTLQLQEHGDATCLCESGDGQYVAVGMPKGLLILNALTQVTVDHWVQNDMSLQRLQFSTIREELYLICTVDEAGVARLFSLAGGKIYLLQAVNEVQGAQEEPEALTTKRSIYSRSTFTAIEEISQDPKEEPEGGSNTIATKYEASFDGSFLGIHFENSLTREGHLEVHRCPRDMWIKELEAVVAKDMARTQAASSSPQPQAEGEPAATTPHTGDETDADPTSSTQSRTAKSDKREDSSEAAEGRNVRFSPANLLFRLRPPAPIQPAPIGNPPHLAKDAGDVIGHGANHLLSAQHLESRQSTFTHLHHHHLKYLPKDNHQSDVEAHFHFLTAGRMMTHGLENPIHAGAPNTVAVWWTRCHNVMHYSLIKTSKAIAEDLQCYRQQSKLSNIVFTLHTARSQRSVRSQAGSTVPEYSSHMADAEPKPDCVWPMSHEITASTVSPCTSLIAFALSNGSVIVWDKNLGMVRRVVHLTASTEVHQIAFLSPSVCPQETSNYPPYGVHANVFLLATCRDSQMFLTECQLGNQTTPTRVTPPIENKDERYVDIKPIPGIPHLVIACRQDGGVYLINLFGGRVIGEVTLPEEFVISNPSNPIIAVGGQGQTLYIQAEQKSFTEENGDSEAEPCSALCVLPMKHYNVLDRHRNKHRPVVPYTIHSTIRNRVDALFTERLSQQAMRKDRMQARWGKMKSDFELMLSLRKEAATRLQTRTAYTPSSIEQSIFHEEMSPNPFFGS